MVRVEYNVHHFLRIMRYFYENDDNSGKESGIVIRCNHPRYARCTLYLKNGKGLAIVQQKFNSMDKSVYWDCVDSWVAADIFSQEGFDQIFQELGDSTDENGLYPTIPVRALMWKLRMKPLPKAFWEMRW